MVTYIGNRCIMTPEGIWSSTKSYEALSLVSHQTTGDGYVSRRAVPTGVDISDDTYWVKMTDFNVQLAAAQSAAEKAEEDAAAALAGVEGKVDATKIITSKEALLALLETGYIADATLVRQLYNELNGKSPFVEFHSQDVDLVEGFNDIYVPGYPKDGFNQYLLSGYAFLSDAITTPLCGTVDASGRFRMLVNCSRDRAATAIRYYILYIPS